MKNLCLNFDLYYIFVDPYYKNDIPSHKGFRLLSRDRDLDHLYKNEDNFAVKDNIWSWVIPRKIRIFH